MRAVLVLMDDEHDPFWDISDEYNTDDKGVGVRRVVGYQVCETVFAGGNRCTRVINHPGDCDPILV